MSDSKTLLSYTFVCTRETMFIALITHFVRIKVFSSPSVFSTPVSVLAKRQYGVITKVLRNQSFQEQCDRADQHKVDWLAVDLCELKLKEYKMIKIELQLGSIVTLGSLPLKTLIQDY